MSHMLFFFFPETLQESSHSVWQSTVEVLSVPFRVASWEEREVRHPRHKQLGKGSGNRKRDPGGDFPVLGTGDVLHE